MTNELRERQRLAYCLRLASSYSSLVIRHSSLRNDGVGVDFDEVAVADEGADFDEGVGGAGFGEVVAVGAANRDPVVGAGDVDAGADDVAEGGSGGGEGAADFLDDVAGLGFGIAGADEVAVVVGGGGAGDEDEVAGADGAGVADLSFPDGS